MPTESIRWSFWLTQKFQYICSMMYVIKVKGVAKIPDYVQLRDEKFTLLAYFRVDRPDKSLEKLGLQDKAEEIMEMVRNMPFGEIKKIEF